MNNATLKKMASDPAEFRRHLLVETPGGVKPLATVLDGWQEQAYARTDPGWKRIAGRDPGSEAGLRSWEERPRGHSKTSDLAVMALWAIAFSPRSLRGVCAAGDRDQAHLLKDALGKLVKLNAWLSDLVEVQASRVTNPRTGSTLAVISSDVDSSWGLLCDFILVDEVSCWPKRDLWDSLLSTAAKKPCLLSAILNAGWQGTWAWGVRELVRIDPSWLFNALPGCVASWITQKDLDEQRRLLPRSVFARCWENCWNPTAGDAVDPDDLEAALRAGITQLDQWIDGWDFSMGLDLGLKRDNAALVCVGRNRKSGAYRLARVWTWRPPVNGKIDLDSIEVQATEARARFKVRKMFVDPWSAEQMVQRLVKAGVPAETYAFTDPNHDRMTRTLLAAFTDHQIELYDHPRLLKELRQMRVIEKTSGKLKIEHPRDGEGHGDCAVGLSLALVAANEIPSRGGFEVYVLGEDSQDETAYGQPNYDPSFDGFSRRPPSRPSGPQDEPGTLSYSLRRGGGLSDAIRQARDFTRNGGG